jgi:hypothetical protein
MLRISRVRAIIQFFVFAASVYDCVFNDNCCQGVYMAISGVTKRGGLDALLHVTEVSALTLAMRKWHEACLLQSYQNPSAGTVR